MQCFVRVLIMVADLPAKAAVLNCNQFNGRYGCSDCEIEGKVVKKGRGHTRVYPLTPVLNMFSNTHHSVQSRNNCCER